MAIEVIGSKQATTMNITKNKISKMMIKRLHTLYHQHGIDEEQHRAMIDNLTDGRTNSTAELTASEAQYLAGWLNGSSGKASSLADDMIKYELKRKRSAVLKRLQQIGIDTTSWKDVNHFLCDKHIAGKNLYEMTSEELTSLIPKLEAIKKKNGKE